MDQTNAEDFHRIFAEAFNSGSPDPLVALYEADASLVPQPGQVASGHQAIREALAQFQAVGEMSAETRYCVQVGDLALASASWQIEGKGPDGEPTSVEGTSADLLKRQPDGRWLLVVDHPFGGS